MTKTAVVYQGLGMPAIVPFHITPGMRHVLEFEFVDEAGEPVDQTGTAWTARVHDALTGEEVAVYATTIAVDLITFALLETDTITLDPATAYEMRIVRDDPGPDMMFAGSVVFTAETYPVMSP